MQLPPLIVGSALIPTDLYELTELLMEDEGTYMDAISTGVRLAESALRTLDELQSHELFAEACAIAVIISSLLSDIARELRGQGALSAVASNMKSVDMVDDLVGDIRASGALSRQRLGDAEMRVVPAMIEDDLTLRNVVTRLRGDRFVIDARRSDVTKDNDDYGYGL